MKIQINEQETYDIKIPETISGQDFLGLMERLDIPRKMLSKELSIVMQESILHEEEPIERPMYKGKLNPKKIEKIERMIKEGLKNTEIAKKFKVSSGRISQIRSKLK